MLNDAKKTSYRREPSVRQAPVPLNRVLRREQIHDRRLTKQQLKQAINPQPSTLNDV